MAHSDYSKCSLFGSDPQIACPGLAGVCTCLRASSGPRCAVANATGICSKSMNPQAFLKQLVRIMRPRDCHGKATGGVHIVTLQNVLSTICQSMFEANSSTIPSTDNIILAVFLPKMYVVGTFCNYSCKYYHSSSQFMYHNLFIWSKNMTLVLNIFWIRSWPSLSGQRSSGTPRLKKTTILEDPPSKGCWIVSRINISVLKILQMFAKCESKSQSVDAM